ncbi:fungal-specific transcription factor domain protein [Xylaria cf. heliscus]|nr:fungal-specific transcription factor domain protein [Xylaria cf. heliscus]
MHVGGEILILLPKVRCDRLRPCTNCLSRGVGSSCVYAITSNVQSMTPGQLHGTAANIQDRINQLENLILSLMHQTAPSSLDQRSGLNPSPPETDSEQVIVTTAQTQRHVSPTLSDHGSIRIQQTVISYVSSPHWAAVLDSIDDLRNHFAQEQETHPRDFDPLQPPISSPKPQLFYCHPIYKTHASIIESLPSRPVVDRLVSHYFNILDIAPGIVHSNYFLREYEELWKAPHTAPIMWVGLLLGMMCLSTQHQQSFLVLTENSPALGQSRLSQQAAGSQVTVDRYRENVIQCLILGQYPKGGIYVLETLILYFLVECFHLKDMEIGIWVLVGNIVQITIHMGYHRDAKHFPKISQFAGEMRRRVWAMIVQLDFSISTQMGLPRLVKEAQINTAEPRNLYDSDFDEHTPELPASRPETEVTPTLYVLAKLRLISVGINVADIVTEPQLHSYAKISELDRQITEARNALPSSLKWDGLASSLNVPSQIIIQRIWLEVTAQQLKIVLHRKFMEQSHLHQQYGISRSACPNAAIKILDLQYLVDEETREDGLLYQSRWRVYFAFINDFLLATSILCVCIKNHTNEQRELDNPGASRVESVDMNKIRQVLETSQVIWSRQCASSREARKAVAALRYVLTDSRVRSGPNDSEEVLPASFLATAISYFPGYSDFMSEYDFASPGSVQANAGTTWPLFATSLDHDVEE